MPTDEKETIMSTDESTPLTQQRLNAGSTNTYSTNSSVTSSNGEENLIEVTSSTLDEEAHRLALKLVECGDNDAMESIVLKNSFALNDESKQEQLRDLQKGEGLSLANRRSSFKSRQRRQQGYETTMVQRLIALFSLAILGLIAIVVLLQLANLVVGPPLQPIGAYRLVEIQEGEKFFQHYSFYSGEDSEGSNGYISYVSEAEATHLNIANVTYEPKSSNTFGDSNSSDNKDESDDNSEQESFIYMSTAPTVAGPRKSVRLEGFKRFNRGLFILDVRHMPAGCATWPAFWLTDEPNWPINGEIDILEGVNDQSIAKTALHTSRQCKMDDVPVGMKTGSWDTAQGVPQQNGDIDMSIVEADDCFVYDKHQWLNQGCVGVSDQDGTLGQPLNQKGGGIFALEWDPINRHISAFTFTPHSTVPQNLKDALETASEKNPFKRVSPDPRKWGLPYVYYPIGTGTNCSADHFKNMHLIFNLALCGSVAGNRFFQDCPLLNEKYGSCDAYVAANTDAMDEVYWKIKGVYVYERAWERGW